MKTLVILVTLILYNCSSSPKNLMVSEGKFSPCPSSPNCVSSQADPNDKEHYIEPILYSNEKEQAKKELISVIEKFPRTNIVKNTSSYLHIEFTTLIMRYVDDIEFYFPADKKQIEVRSASRLGHSDLGVNRKRMNRIKQEFNRIKK